MRRLIRIAVPLGLIGVVLVSFAVGSHGAPGRVSPAPSPSGVIPCSEQSPQCPPASPAETWQQSGLTAPWVFSAPPEGAPSIDADQAVAIAWSEGGDQTGTGAQPIYAMLPAGSLGPETPSKGTPVWLIRFTGACVAPNLPLSGSPPPCSKMSWNVVIDATSGVYVQSFNTADS